MATHIRIEEIAGKWRAEIDEAGRLGLGDSLTEWALHAAKPIHKLTAAGILIATLPVLAKHYGITERTGRRWKLWTRRLRLLSSSRS